MEYQVLEDKIIIINDGKEAGYITFEKGEITHTLIYPEYRGMGLAEPLVRKAFDEIRKKGLMVSASCWYAKEILEKDKKMNQLERMNAGLIYDPNAPEIQKLQYPYLDKLKQFNSLDASDFKGKRAYMKEVFAKCGENCYIELPFRANWGGAHVYMGDNFYANFNLTLVDDGNIYIGNQVMIGPNVIICTANHPIEPSLRARGLQYNRDVHIGNNVWIGANVMVVPGVSIGDNSVIGAGSVVVKDIPANCVAVGNPCKVIREIGEKDKITYYKDDVIDWENL